MFGPMCVCVCVYTQVLSHVQLFVTPWAVDCKAPLPMEFSRQEYWSRLPFPSLGDLPDPKIQPVSLVSPTLQADSLPTEPPGKIIHDIDIYNYTLSQHLLITYYAPSTGQRMVIQQ